MSSSLESGPAVGAVIVDISAGDHVFSPPLRGISIGTAGDLHVDLLDTADVVIPGGCLALGIQHAIGIKKIYQTGTAAANMIGWR